MDVTGVMPLFAPSGGRFGGPQLRGYLMFSNCYAWYQFTPDNAGQIAWNQQRTAVNPGDVMYAEVGYVNYAANPKQLYYIIENQGGSVSPSGIALTSPWTTGTQRVTTQGSLEGRHAEWIVENTTPGAGSYLGALTNFGAMEFENGAAVTPAAAVGFPGDTNNVSSQLTMESLNPGTKRYYKNPTGNVLAVAVPVRSSQGTNPNASVPDRIRAVWVAAE